MKTQYFRIKSDMKGIVREYKNEMASHTTGRHNLSKEFFNKSLEDGSFILCTELGYILTYTKEELEGKDLLCHTTGFDNEMKAFCIKGERYYSGEIQDNLVSYENEIGRWHFLELSEVGKYFYPVNRKRNTVKRKHDNWKRSVSKRKFERGLDECIELQRNGSPVWYNHEGNVVYRIEKDANSKDVYIKYSLSKLPEEMKYLREEYHSLYFEERPTGLAKLEAAMRNLGKTKRDKKQVTEWTDKHYDFTYTLTEKDIEKGEIKLDPYFVAKEWRIGSKDDSGALFHSFKLFPRWAEKNSFEREVMALYKQTKRMAEIYNIDLGE